MCRGTAAVLMEFIEALKTLELPLHKRLMEIIDEQLDESPFEMPEIFIVGFRLGAEIAENYWKDLFDAGK